MVEHSIFPGLPIERDHAAGLSRAPRVCIATYEIVGPSRSGGIGTAYFSLASALAAAGHDVTILYLLRNHCEQGPIDIWRSYYRQRGIRFVPLPRSRKPANAPTNMATAYDAYRWLKARDFDVIHFPELLGHGYYSVLAKHQGLDFHNTVICVGTHSPTFWLKATNREITEGLEDLELDFMERQSVALADVVVSPSQYMLRWLRTNGWVLPERCYVQQYLLSPESRTYCETEEAATKHAAVREIVFFGRLEERKGLGLFCDALDRLARMGSRDFSVIFLGKPWRVNGEAAIPYIEERAARWPFSWQISSDRDHAAALQFLHGNGRVAVIPSLEDNLPNTVLECLCARIPFLASRTGGIPELISADDLDGVTFAPNPDDLAGRLLGALDKGVSIVRPAIDPEENRHRWIQWHRALLSRPETRSTRRAAFTEAREPLVTVCLTHSDRPQSLRHAITSLEAQDWPNLEVILASETGTSTETLAALNRLQSASHAKVWQIIREPKHCLGAARNEAAMRAKGDYLLFMDDDSYAKPDAISTFMRVGANSGADILTCFLDVFTGEERPGKGRDLGRWLFLGAAVAPSMFHNYLGVSTMFLRKAAFRSIGGFTQDCGATWQDREFLAKAVLMGLRLEVVPKALAWYRNRTTSPSTNQYENRIRSIRPYLNAAPPAVRDVLPVALGMHLRLGRAQLVNGSTRLGDVEVFRLVRELAASEHRRVASFLNAWLEYRWARSNMPPGRWDRVPQIARQLVRGRYHRFAHGFGSALRDFRKPPKVLELTADLQRGAVGEEGSMSWTRPIGPKSCEW